MSSIVNLTEFYRWCFLVTKTDPLFIGWYAEHCLEHCLWDDSLYEISIKNSNIFSTFQMQGSSQVYRTVFSPMCLATVNIWHRRTNLSVPCSSSIQQCQSDDNISLAYTMSVRVSDQRLYWVDDSLVPFSVSLNGSLRTIRQSNESTESFGLAVSSFYMYLSDWQSKLVVDISYNVTRGWVSFVVKKHLRWVVWKDVIHN